TMKTLSGSQYKGDRFIWGSFKTVCMDSVGWKSTVWRVDFSRAGFTQEEFRHLLLVTPLSGSLHAVSQTS
ncbi:MAG: hypothetical protein WBN08_05335, partial [Thiogranum sp.]